MILMHSCTHTTASARRRRRRLLRRRASTLRAGPPPGEPSVFLFETVAGRVCKMLRSWCCELSTTRHSKEPFTQNKNTTTAARCARLRRARRPTPFATRRPRPRAPRPGPPRSTSRGELFFVVGIKAHGAWGSVAVVGRQLADSWRRDWLDCVGRVCQPWARDARQAAPLSATLS